MRVRQVGCDQGSCDVGVAMCVRVCVCVFVFVMRMYDGCFSMSILKWRAKSDPIVMSNFVSVNCKCRSVSCDVFRAAVTWTG